jgi:hypothetical protein
VKNRLRRRLGGVERIVDLGDAGDVADGEDELLLLLLGRGLAADLHGVAFDLDVETVGLQPEIRDLLLQSLRRRRRLLGVGVADAERLARVLHEVPESHWLPPARARAIRPRRR